MNAMTRQKTRREQNIGPTTETLAKLGTDTLQILMLTGKISADEERAGREIVDMHRAIQKGLFRTQKMGVGGGFGDPSDALTEYEAKVYSKRYLPWSREASRQLVARWPQRFSRLDLVFAVCDDNVTISSIGQRYDMADKHVLSALRRALFVYEMLMRMVKIDRESSN